MTTQKIDVFLDLLRRSGLVEKDQLNAVLLGLTNENAGQLPTDTDLVVQRIVESGLITRWQADKILEGRHRGFFLGKYKLLGHLGSGGMSMVYLGEHVLMQRRVAIKVLPKNRVADSSYLARFYREAQAASKLDHRNIVRAYDVDKEGDNHYIVMEYIEGRDLQHIVKEDGPLDYITAADFIRQAAEGLHHAHQAGLIHRDVKPANLLVDQKKVVKVLDLGLARFTDDSKASLTVAYDENVLGTADYLPPEQAINSHSVDARSDIYGLGCSMYYVLTGHPPFTGGTLPQRLMMHQKQPPPSIHIDRPDAPADLIAICMKMMAKKPNQRYQSMAEVAAALAQWLVARGQKIEPGSSGGSSIERLGGPSTGAAAARASGLPLARKLDDSNSSAKRTFGELAWPGEENSASGQSSSSVDTDADWNRDTVKKASGKLASDSNAGKSDASHASSKKTLQNLKSPGKSSPSGSGIGSKKNLPKAQPISSGLADLLADENLPPLPAGNQPLGLDASFGFPEEASPAYIPFATAKKKKSPGIPLWVYYVTGGVVAFFLMLLFLVRYIVG
jgi:serine/threonine-protein kinase